MTDDQKQRILKPLLAFVLGVCLTALVFTLVNKSKTASPGATSASQESSEDAGTAEKAPLDIAATFPSWNPDSASLKEMVDFVEAACDPSSPSYVEPEDRIATFDMDGTIIAEKAPFYVDYMLLLHRVLDDPDHQADPDVVTLCENIREYANQGKKNSDYSPGRRIAIAHEFAGMTPEEFRAYVNNFLDTVEVGGFDGMTYGESFYKPMIEVIDYLRSKDFDVWMVSACEREVVRAAVGRLGFPLDHVIATDVAYASSKQGDEAPDGYNMGQDEVIVLSEPLLDSCKETAKSLAIAREIGRPPLMAFGNSSGDYGMLNYAEASGGMGLLVVADDSVRDYGDEEKAAEEYETVAKESWTSFSMKDDWATIYGEGVVKTCLPAEEKEELAAAA